MVPASPLRRLLAPGILALGAALLWQTRPRPMASTALNEGRNGSCLSNLSQISRAFALYARDFDSKIPLAVDPEDRFNPNLWTPENTNDTPFAGYVKTAPFLHVLLRPYVASPEVFHCPSDNGWTISRLAQPDLQTGGTIGLKDVRPTSFAKYGTSYYLWTTYGFNLLTASDVPHPERKVVLFDGDLWHQNQQEQRAGELFLDGHAAYLTKEQHAAAAPNQD